MKKAKQYSGKNFFFEFLRYLHNWKYDSLNHHKREIDPRKRFRDDFLNLSNFSKFDDYSGFFGCEAIMKKD